MDIDFVPGFIRAPFNFFKYRKYVKELDRDTLEELRKDIRIMGFNDGVESFQTFHESQKELNRICNHSALRRKAKMARLKKQI
ncbi:hypothetical protein [Evansella tamaricis]|uniref:Uncharacterized protein n=1 Tax=Evansella tamaricis TaxID=2069301 RepID=A0ABS6JJT8_9BACI|nr:hypothetical protein [Evansella tamaricis]MBU9713655.1 hypothetical protein [Evansella tamaricis]